MVSRERDNLEADLSAYLDGELSEARAHEVEQHLAESAEARRLLDELREVSGQLGLLPRRPAPDSLAAELACQVEIRQTPAAQPAARRQRIIRLFAQLSASAAVVAACVFVGYQTLKLPANVAPGGAAEPTSIVRGGEKTHDKSGVLGEEADVAVAAGGRGADRTRQLAGLDVKDGFGKGKLGVQAEARDLEVAAAPALDAVRAISLGTEIGKKVSPTDGEWRMIDSLSEVNAKGTPAETSSGLLYAYFGEGAAGEEAPFVTVQITPQSKSEYEAVAATLAGWERERFEALGQSLADTELDEVERNSPAEHGVRIQELAGGGTLVAAADATVAEAPVIERVFEVRASDVRTRIHELGVSVPDRMRVQMGYAPKEGSACVPAPASAGLAGNWSFETGREGLDDEDTVQPVQTQRSPSRRANAKSPVGSPTQERMSSDEPAAAPAAPQARGSTERARRGGVRVDHPPARPETRQSVVRKQVPQLELEERRTRGTTTAPAAVPPLRAKGIAPPQPHVELGVPMTQPTQPAGELKQSSLPHVLAGRLMNYLFPAAREQMGALIVERWSAASQPAGGDVIVHVLLWPPPAATTAPATSPTAPPTTSPAAVPTSQPTEP